MILRLKSILKTSIRFEPKSATLPSKKAPKVSAPIIKENFALWQILRLIKGKLSTNDTLQVKQQRSNIKDLLKLYDSNAFPNFEAIFGSTVLFAILMHKL